MPDFCRPDSDAVRRSTGAIAARDDECEGSWSHHRTRTKGLREPGSDFVSETVSVWIVEAIAGGASMRPTRDCPAVNSSSGPCVVQIVRKKNKAADQSPPQGNMRLEPIYREKGPENQPLPDQFASKWSCQRSLGLVWRKG